MPYDANGNYSATVPRDQYGFINFLASPIDTNPYDGPHGELTAIKASALINKEVG
jgi:hypothetical protein